MSSLGINRRNHNTKAGRFQGFTWKRSVRVEACSGIQDLRACPFCSTLGNDQSGPESQYLCNSELDVEIKPLRFIGEPIQVQFDQPPALEKRPGCPDRFVWRGEVYRIVEKLNEWHDYTRRGRMAANMRPTHAAVASRRGSWGVGRDFFRVRTDTGQVFDLYYDRAPKGVNERKGAWFLYREMSAPTT